MSWWLQGLVVFIYAGVATDQWFRAHSPGMTMMYIGYSFAGVGAILVMKAAEHLPR